MAREIQSQSNRTQGGKAVVAQLGNAVFWVIVAIAVPVEEFLRPIPEIAPYAHLAPILLYVLAAWSFLRAIRTLQHVAATRMWNPHPARAPAHLARRAPSRSATARHTLTRPAAW